MEPATAAAEKVNAGKCSSDSPVDTPGRPKGPLVVAPRASALEYATFFYAQLDQQRYVNAGHNAPYLLRAGQLSTADGRAPGIEQLSVGGTVVGMFPDMDYEEATVELSTGDVLLVFTDGVPEAHNRDDEEFGEERLQDLLRQAAHLPADEIAARLSAGMNRWIGDAERYDDLTFIVMKVR